MITIVNGRAEIKAKTIQGFVQALAGIFRLTPKEVKIFSVILFLLGEDQKEQVITSFIKGKVAEITGHSFQVITNYVTKLRSKRALVGDRPHPVFIQKLISIEYER